MTTDDEGLSLTGRIRALLYGVALGDALGAPVEKLSAGDIRKRYGRVTSLDTRWHKMDLPEAARNGRVRVPTGPGLGVEPDMSDVAKYRQGDVMTVR